MTLKLAARFAIAIPFDMNLSRQFMQEARLETENAKRVDAQQNPPQCLEYFDFIDARVGGDYFGLLSRGRY